MLLFAFLPLLLIYSPIMKKMLRVDPINTCEISEILLNRMRKKKKKSWKYGFGTVCKDC
jgi:hypothetical protein